MRHNTDSLEPCLSKVWRYAPDIDVGQMGFFSSRFFPRLHGSSPVLVVTPTLKLGWVWRISARWSYTGFLWQLFACRGVFSLAACRPVFRIAFFVDCPKNFDPVG
jgi:hypothetical protein